ncbi:hypothetical protein Ciccas_011258 [Cichlidogyrus casuarinus]|uniref:Uncharacterized protein n=1 Tax=Cichlidogyrus casuarinus TaxID=1844966 RepID=A0ABD2PSF0_9PLAT
MCIESDLSYTDGGAGLGRLNNPGYSARRERMRQEQEERVRMMRMQQNRKSNLRGGSSVQTLNHMESSLDKGSIYRSTNSVNGLGAAKTFDELRDEWEDTEGLAVSEVVGRLLDDQ